jgi:hypothetical protein
LILYLLILCLLLSVKLLQCLLEQRSKRDVARRRLRLSNVLHAVLLLLCVLLLLLTSALLLLVLIIVVALRL